MGESFDHCPAGWIGQRRKCCTQSIHNPMVVDCSSMSSVNFAIPGFQFPDLRCRTPALMDTLRKSGEPAALWRWHQGRRNVDCLRNLLGLSPPCWANDFARRLARICAMSGKSLLPYRQCSACKSSRWPTVPVRSSVDTAICSAKVISRPSLEIRQAQYKSFDGEPL